MKKIFALMTVFALLLCTVSTSFAESAIDTIMNVGTTQAFSDEAVAAEDIEIILQAGLAAASAINQQPWFFVAVTDAEVMEKLSSGGGMPSGMPAGAPAGMTFGAPAGDGASAAPAAAMPAAAAMGSAKAALGDSPVAIIIYMDKNTKSPDASFDCGMAAQNMYIAAAALGYGVKIVSSPTMTLNGTNHDELCELLGVDPSMEAIAVLLIGYPNAEIDSTSSATTRYALDEKTSLK